MLSFENVSDSNVVHQVGQYTCMCVVQVDTQTNQVRREQRTNEELQEQVDNLNVQLEHLNSRYATRRGEPGSL